MNLLYLTILFPLIGFLLLAFSCGRWSETLTAMVGVGSVGLSALTTVQTGIDFFAHDQQVFTQILWTWIHVDNFKIEVNLLLDGLSFTMLSIVTGVGFFIHVFASWYMHGEEGYSRFFAYTNLFIASMVVLILADNLMLMYLGWEGVGLCSYLLIGFYYSNPENGKAAMKAFITTRVGDVFLALALFILYKELGTWNFQEMMVLAPVHFSKDKYMLYWATIMLLGGAVGKSAQLPLQTWLADAMVGPTPVSALIHAATMVTAGVYLIARAHGLFLLTPEILHLIGIIGAITLILAGFAALIQTDIKRVLAYSTMSQIGYMFLALGVQAWHAAIFHLMTHAFFKALLFLSSGSVILACHHEQNIFKMGGLRKSLPLVYICFLVGGAALAALPLVSAGFYSKGDILFGVLAKGHINLMVAGLIGTFLTSIYTFFMIFTIFHGKEKIHAYAGRGITHHVPLLVLLILSTFVGALITPPLAGVLPGSSEFGKDGKVGLEIVSSILVIMGMLVAARLSLSKNQIGSSVNSNILGRFSSIFWFIVWGFDWLYDNVFVKPYLGIAWLLKRDPLNTLINFPTLIARIANKGLVFSENGYLRWYVASMSIGGLVVLILLLTI